MQVGLCVRVWELRGVPMADIIIHYNYYLQYMSSIASNFRRGKPPATTSILLRPIYRWMAHLLK